MGKAAKERLSRALGEHLNTIHETFQVLDQQAASSLDKVSWKDVIEMGEQVSKQATMVGMLWSGERTEIKALEENMGAYFNTLQGFLLLSHGSTVGAGPTLLSCIHSSVKQIIDSSFMLMKESVSSYGSRTEAQTLTIPQLVGTVWEACAALKKTPSTNVTAIGRALTKVAVSMKDVLREMKELKQASTDDVSMEEKDSDHHESEEDDSFVEEDIGNDLSVEEMKIAQLIISVVSAMLVLIKELIRSITSLLKQESLDEKAVDSLEKLLKSSQGFGVQIDELGACVYPPQEISVMKDALGKIFTIIGETEIEMENLKGCSQDFCQACNSLRSSVKHLESELDSFGEVDLVPKMESLVISN